MADSLLKRASEKFEYENFTEAIEIYEQLMEVGFLQEEMLYRLAFMHEKKENFSTSIYYLRKIQWEFGGKRIEEKIGLLMEKANRERLSPGEVWTSYRLFLHHHYFSLTILLGIVTFLSGTIFIRRLHEILRAMGILSGFAAVLLGLALLEQFFFSPRLAVVMQNTAFYDAPAFGANFRSLPIGQGSTVIIIDTQDVWHHISMDQFDTWVPAFVVREIAD
ncbi:MAG: hypothetical protein SF052_19990 [Bacteroidia bacterium]|nr:hypothetical protein [Bacteroidia bacterium]